MTETELTRLSNVELADLALTNEDARGILKKRLEGMPLKRQERFFQEYSNWKTLTNNKKKDIFI